MMLFRNLYFSQGGSLGTGGGGGGGTVTSVSVVTANGFAGTVANPTTTPAITLMTTATGVLLGNGTAISGVTGANDGVLITSNTGVVSWLANGTTGQVLTATTGSPPSWQNAGGGGGTTSFTLDNGTATPSSGVISMLGGGNGARGAFSPQAGSTVFFFNSGVIPSNEIELNLMDNGNNICLGGGAGNNSLSGTANVAIGFTAGHSLVGGNNNTLVGTRAGNSLTGNAGTTGSDNVAYGTTALTGSSTGNRNTAIGTGALSGAVDSYNIGIGYQAGSNYNSGESNNIVISNVGVPSETNVIRIGTQGTGAGQQNSCFIAGIFGVTPSSPQMVTISSTGNLGSQAIPSGGITTLNGNSGSATGSTVTITTGASNTQGTAVFTGSGATITQKFDDANNNLGLGTNAIAHSSGTLANNVAVGKSTIATATSASDCVAIGNVSLTAMTTPSIGRNTGCGSGTLGVLTTGNENTAIGAFAGYQFTTGSQNTLIGHNAGGNYTTSESFNIQIGSNVLGTLGESQVLRIGLTQGAGTDVTKCFIGGIAGVTVTSTAAVLVNTSTGQLGTIISSRRYKENIRDMNKDSEAILKLRPVCFNLKSDKNKELQYGLIAEEVHDVMSSLVTYNKEGDPETVRYHDLPILLLNEIQKLRREMDNLKKGKHG